MAESCTTTTMTSSRSSGDHYSNCNRFSITHMADDHLVTIMLLLPVDSVLSFAMTCRRFKALASSDTLWEAICRRDWGNRSLDALLASSEIKQLSWKKLYRQVSQLDTVSCVRLSSSEDESFPKSRASHSLNFVKDFLVLFGGGCEGGRHLDDTWVAYVGNEYRRILRWQKINSGVPSGRFGQTCVVISETLILFGGINENGIRQNDTWVGQVGFDDTLSITVSWRLLDVGSIAPSPRGAHAGCCFDDNKMVIHGGIGLDGRRLSDTWVLDLSDGMASATWHEIVTVPSPAARSGHTLTYIGGNQMVLFGGRGVGYEVLNDVWLFDADEGCPRWMKLMYESCNIPNGVPLPRVGHSATLVLGAQVLIYGGEDTYRHRKDDFWVLDMTSVPTIKLWPDSQNSNIRSGKMWKRVKAEGEQPGRRSFHRACADHSGRYMYIFGGMVDGVLQPAETSGLRFDGELYLVELQL